MVTILSVTALEFDLVSRNAMLQGLMSIEDGGKVLPFLRGDVHDIPQGEGGEQRGPTHAPAHLSGTTRCVESCGRSDGGR